VLATSNGHVAKDIAGSGGMGKGSTSKGKGSSGAPSVRLGLGVGMMAVVGIVVGGAGMVVMLM
jgi:hypothetical protein